MDSERIVIVQNNFHLLGKLATIDNLKISIVRSPTQAMLEPQKEVGQSKGLLSKEEDSIYWVVQVYGERGSWIKTIVQVNIGYESKNCVLRRNLEPTKGRYYPCELLALFWGWPLMPRKWLQREAYSWAECFSFVTSGWTLSRHISVHECTYELC